jgi:hypothetical protein
MSLDTVAGVELPGEAGYDVEEVIGAGSRAEEDEWGRESRVGFVEESMMAK